MDRTPRYKDEIDFRELLRTPRRLFGYSVTLTSSNSSWPSADKCLAYYGHREELRSCLGRIERFLGVCAGHTACMRPASSARGCAPGGSRRMPACCVRAGGCSAPIARPATGSTGRATGPPALMLDPKNPGTSIVATGWTNGAKVTEIYRTLQEGIIRNGMASYNYLPPGDRFALIDLVRSFHPAPPADAEAGWCQLKQPLTLEREQHSRADSCS